MIDVFHCVYSLHDATSVTLNDITKQVDVDFSVRYRLQEGQEQRHQLYSLYSGNDVKYATHSRAMSVHYDMTDAVPTMSRVDCGSGWVGS